VVENSTEGPWTTKSNKKWSEKSGEKEKTRDIIRKQDAVTEAFYEVCRVH